MNNLIEKLSSLRSQFNCFNENEREAYHTLSETIKVLSERTEPCEDDAEPTIERTGKWLRVPCKFVTSKSYVYQCNKCEAASHFASEFCPHCGAKME